MAVELRRISRSVGAKLFTVMLFVLLLSLGLLGWANVRLHRQHLDAARLASAERMTDVIRRSAAYYMLRNDHAALRHILETMGEQPISGLRIYDPNGAVKFSTDARELGRVVSREKIPLAGNRIITQNGERTLDITRPIANEPSCSTASCHAHSPASAVLGTVDANLSLAPTDTDIRVATWQFIGYSAVAVLAMLAVTGVFVYHFVHKPVRALRDGTKRLGSGELGVQIPVRSADELGGLASSFNVMSKQILDAREEITAWTRTLEDRVRDKTAELQTAHEQMLQAEKLTSLGKLAAVVAHEINNPLSGILTYAKLLRRWVDRGEMEDRAQEMRESLQLIESESKRCGDIVRSLLTFARVAPLNIAPVDMSAVIRQCVKLVEHKMALGNITPILELPPDLPAVRGDAAQLEQLILALVINAIEAMPHEGTLHLKAAPTDDRQNVVVTVEDDGTGIDPNLVPRLFEPFVTTKEEKGVGLGLAISRTIVERHHGHIEVVSQVGRGTTFTITFPAMAEEGAGRRAQDAEVSPAPRPLPPAPYPEVA
jgi:two-component system NtrC family sensor kinase